MTGILRLSRSIFALAALLLGSAHCLAETTTQPQEAWILFGGDYTTVSAMDLGSMRRDGDVVYARQVIVGRSSALVDPETPLDYVIVEFAYDCVAKTTWSIRAHLHKLPQTKILTRELPLRPRSTVNSSQAMTFMPFACGETPVEQAQGPYPSIDAFLKAHAYWAGPAAAQAKP